MATTKEFGCGGRYSTIQFIPCRICPIKNDKLRCRSTILIGAGYLGIHKEWFTDLAGKAKWRATRPVKEEDKEDPFDCDCESCAREQRRGMKPFSHGH